MRALKYVGRGAWSTSGSSKSSAICLHLSSATWTAKVCKIMAFWALFRKALGHDFTDFWGQGREDLAIRVQVAKYEESAQNHDYRT